MKCNTVSKNPTTRICIDCGKEYGQDQETQKCIKWPDEHLMVDLETLGTGPCAVITQIGACWFDMEGNVGKTFSANINIQSALDVGLQVDGDTIKWWFQQPSRTFVNNTDKITKVLRQFANFCTGAKHVWSHATFDMPILFNAYRECGEKIPFHYRSPKDIRTLVWLWGGKAERPERDDKHDALADCLYQVKYVTKCYKDIQDERN
jgi:hypothetical protein